MSLEQYHAILIAMRATIHSTFGHMRCLQSFTFTLEIYIMYAYAIKNEPFLLIPLIGHNKSAKISKYNKSECRIKKSIRI